MNQNITISNRLKRIASYLPKKPHFADIGSDHAYLPCYVCLHDDAAKAIAGEVVEGPFHSAKATVKANHLEAVVDVRLGDGLAVLHKGEVNQVVIAGMGGSLIKSILENGMDKLEKVERIIAQPNVDAKAVRKWLYHHGYEIIQEEIVEENEHFYEIIVADKMNTIQNLTEKDFMFGPILLVNKSKPFYNKWRSEKEKLHYIRKQLDQASVPQIEKLRRFDNEVTWIEEVLRDEKQD
ncbi:tRNA (adenine(22)-N(1))-methyltransferase [Virgibacillus necropolis]|uniref:tRNA (Adenine(22)-N(1))-methyltransferase TrmK n=1 Tax=Virgibacillus necropolis TaxID=163877 RepID=A0A221MC10_9BACI|nr:class I SAM-dependent methyltransferase [Virgibacillus necropolis]ASN05208.1 tRNA (adenine(22)-N(1))-methyltransferase TrmK [Virgibacillus necropolis]